MKTTVDVAFSDPSFQGAMSDSQQYPLNNNSVNFLHYSCRIGDVGPS